MRDYEDESGDYSEDQKKFIKDFSKSFRSDVKMLAQHYILHFFQGKSFHCGGEIPKYFLSNERRLSMVLNYDIIKGVTRAYKYLEPHLKNSGEGEIAGDIMMVNNILGELARAGVPQQFAGGMMCLYLEFIEGVNIGTEP